MLMQSALAAPADTCRFIKIAAERLPDLSIPRSGHQTLVADGELTVLGGHTTGFVPTPTVEYLKDGDWHTVQMAYPHDDGMAVLLRNGSVLMAGGHKDNLGIGQTFEAEIYHPATHSFGHYGCMCLKRAMAFGSETDSGRVVISGNWYGKDGIELFDGNHTFSYLKDASVERTAPYILRIAPDNVLIFGCQGTRGQMLGDSSAIVDRLKGEPFLVPLFREWKPVSNATPIRSNADGFIGDETIGDYTYLILARDNVVYDHLPEQSGQSMGQSAILQVHDTVFSLLPTLCPIPKESGIGGLIDWYGSVTCDRQTRRAYVPGIDREKRLYLLCVYYSKQPAPLVVYYTDPLPDCGFNTPVLTADGNLAIVGGNFEEGLFSTNYEPVASAWLIRLHDDGKSASNTSPWIWWVLGLSLMAVIWAIAVLLYRRTASPADVGRSRNAEEPGAGSNGVSVPGLFPRLCDLMDRQQLFRNSELTVSDVAAALATNTHYVTDCIKSERGQTFTQFINAYRVEYVKRQLSQYPDKPVSVIYLDAGFSSERSFCRIFKEATGMTTRDWISMQQKR